MGWKLSDLIKYPTAAEVLGHVGCSERKQTIPRSRFLKATEDRTHPVMLFILVTEKQLGFPRASSVRGDENTHS